LIVIINNIACKHYIQIEDQYININNINIVYSIVASILSLQWSIWQELQGSYGYQLIKRNSTAASEVACQPYSLYSTVLRLLAVVVMEVAGNVATPLVRRLRPSDGGPFQSAAI
jgi:hypothetical protein